MKNSDCYCTSIRKASRRLTSLYDAALEPVGVNLAQFSLLRNIHRNDRVSLTELGKITELDRSTVGRNVRVLERMGLAKTISGDDHREAVVIVDTDGLRVLEQGAPLWDAMQERLEAKLGGDAATRLLESLAEL
jgi:DNA-binding MarR family transcriptional regulator